MRTHSSSVPSLREGDALFCLRLWINMRLRQLPSLLGNTSSLLYSFSAVLVWFLRTNQNSNQVHNWKLNMTESACVWRDKDAKGKAKVGKLFLHTSLRDRFMHPNLIYSCNSALETLLYAVVITRDVMSFPWRVQVFLLKKYIFSNAEVFKLKCTCFHLVNKTSACWYLCWAGRLAVSYSIRKKKTPLVMTDLVRSPLL